MQQFQNRLYHFSLSFVQILTLLLTGILFLSGLLVTTFAIDMNTQDVLLKWDNPLLTITGSLLLCLLFWGISFLVAKKGRTAHRILRLFVLAWCLLLCMILILFSKSAPSGDAYSVYSIAENLALNNTSVIHPTDSYISYYPQQIGLVAFWEIIMRVWNLLPVDLHAYHFIKIIYAFLACIIILFQEQTVHTLWKDEKADCLYLILAGANCPLIMYTSFVYGEIPSFAAISAGIYFLTRLLCDFPAAAACNKESLLKNSLQNEKKSTTLPKVLFSLGSIFFLTLSVMLRKNSLIYVIAAVLVMALWGIYHRRYCLLLLTAFCILCTTTVLPLTEKYYELRSGNSISSGVTAMSYFAMGMQEAPRANGWYNNFNFDTYQRSGMNAEIANEISMDAIRERLTYFQANPGYTAEFYLEKYLSQWADGSYACRQASLATFGGRSDFFISLYEGDYSHYVIAYCNLYQNILYLGVFAYCLSSVITHRKKELTANCQSNVTTHTNQNLAHAHSLPAYLGLIAVLGGFMFHMLWEANSRYIFLYGLSLLPYAAKGLSLLGNILSSTLHRRK